MAQLEEEPATILQPSNLWAVAGAPVLSRAPRISFSTCEDPSVGYSWTDPNKLVYEERPPKPGEEARRTADLTTALGLEQSRARLWRYPPHSTGRRHRDHVQEEVFVVVTGTLTALLGDEPERVDLGPGGVVRVEPMTALQLRNESNDELVFFAYGAPPLHEGADFLDDVELPPRD